VSALADLKPRLTCTGFQFN